MFFRLIKKKNRPIFLWMVKKDSQKFMLGILVALSLTHGLNDVMQSIVSAVYPLIKTNLNLTYGEIGLVALTYQISSSIMQPVFGYICLATKVPRRRQNKLTQDDPLLNGINSPNPNLLGCYCKAPLSAISGIGVIPCSKIQKEKGNIFSKTKRSHLSVRSFRCVCCVF